MKVTPVVLNAAHRLFAPEELDEAIKALDDLASAPMPGEESILVHERLQFAALRLSYGDLSRLKKAISLAKSDPRDIFVDAGMATWDWPDVVLGAGMVNEDWHHQAVEFYRNLRTSLGLKDTDKKK